MEPPFSQILLKAHLLCMLKTFCSPLSLEIKMQTNSIKKGFLKKEDCLIEGPFMIMLERIFESFK